MNRAPAGVTDPCIVAALRVYVKLLRATKAVLARVEPRLAAQGLTATQLGVLEVILHLGPLSQRDLGRKVLTSAGNMTDVIDKLEARGLVCRSRLQTDRRSVQVALTPQGRRLIEALFPRHAEDIAAAMGALTPPEMEQLGDLLRRLGRGAAEDPGEPATPDDTPARAAGRAAGRGPLAGSGRTHQFSA